MSSSDPIQLEPPGQFTPTSDKRPRVLEPPPVKLVAVADVHVEASAGLERELDDFYAGILRFDREPAAEGEEHAAIRYRAENFRLWFHVVERRVDRDGMRPTMIEVPLLSTIESLLRDDEIEYVRQRGLLPGQDSLLLRDPAGNWVEVIEIRPF